MSVTRWVVAFVPLLALPIALAAPAVAAPPPNLPLPACETVDGRKVGACPKQSPEVAGSAVGRFSPNATLDVYVDPAVPACDHWAKYAGQVWSPSPCYQAIRPIEVVGCGYVDLVSGSFREVQCAAALYAGDVKPPAPLFSIKSVAGSTCGGSGDFNVYAYGGPAATPPGSKWAEKGPKANHCGVTLLGPQPNGLYGPTWVKLRATVDVAITGRNTGSTGTPTSSEFFIPIDGDLRDLGPIAAFAVGPSEGGKLSFVNQSFHTTGEAMTFQWSFGDGGTSSEKDPTHRYAASGSYKVTLTATDQSGDKNNRSSTVKVDFALVVDLSVPLEPAPVGEEVPVTLVVRNPFELPATSFALVGANGLRMNPDHLVHVSGPTPAVPPSLGPGESATFTFVVKPRVPGRFTLEGGAQAWMDGQNVSAKDTAVLFAPARLAITLATSITAQTKVGDEFDVVATLTNNEDKDITNIKSQPLELMPSDIVTLVSGPTTATGTDPRVDPITLAPKAMTTISWKYRAAQKGAATLRALVSGKDPTTEALFFVSDTKRFAIETAALDITKFRMQPGSPVPGTFGNLRGFVTNIGSVPLTDIKFAVTSTPKIQVLEQVLAKVDPKISPRIPRLEPDESQEFLIPFGMVSDAGGLGSYTIDLTMTGQATIDGMPTPIEGIGRTAGALDLSPYWTNILSEVKRTLLDFTLEVFDGVNSWGDSSTLGGVTVGGGEGVLGAFQKMGNGILKVNDIIGEASGDGGQRLTEQGTAIVGAVREYLHTTSPKTMLKDLRAAGYNVTVEGVGVFADWMYKVDKAQASGDLREVSRLLAEPATELAVGIGVEAAGAKLFTKLISLPAVRKPLRSLKRAPDDVDGLPVDQVVDGEYADLKDMPTGVRITGETVARAGITLDEHAWMIEMAKEHGVAFFVRPRPKDAAKFARAGYNAKPMAIKIKSVNDIDAKWLGYEDYADSQGLVVLREPKDPFPALMEAVERGDLDRGSKEIEEVIKRYNNRLAEWKSKDDLLAKLNKDGGFDIQRYGKTIKTQAVLDADGLLRFSHNNQPVYSDIDLMQIAYPNGKPIPPALHEQISREAGFGFDSQHGDTASTSDFGDWETAKKFVNQYGGEHMRGGDPLVIVQPDVTTLGYVNSIDLPAGPVTGSGYDLYGKAQITYEGAGTK
jgi:PKD repeat protein